MEDDAHDDFYLRISSAYGELIYALRKFLSLRCCASPRASCAGRNNSAGRIVDITVPMAENVVRAVKKTQNRLKIRLHGHSRSRLALTVPHSFTFSRSCRGESASSIRTSFLNHI